MHVAHASARPRIQSLVYKNLETPAPVLPPVLPPVQMHEKRFAGFIIFAL